jgi:hypothetical protein
MGYFVALGLYRCCICVNMYSQSCYIYVFLWLLPVVEPRHTALTSPGAVPGSLSC